MHGQYCCQQIYTTHIRLVIVANTNKKTSTNTTNQQILKRAINNLINKLVKQDHHM